MFYILAFEVSFLPSNPRILSRIKRKRLVSSRFSCGWSSVVGDTMLRGMTKRCMITWKGSTLHFQTYQFKIFSQSAYRWQDSYLIGLRCGVSTSTSSSFLYLLLYPFLRFNFVLANRSGCEIKGSTVWTTQNSGIAGFMMARSTNLCPLFLLHADHPSKESCWMPARSNQKNVWKPLTETMEDNRLSDKAHGEFKAAFKIWGSHSSKYKGQSRLERESV
jgi:hypothetical protein